MTTMRFKSLNPCLPPLPRCRLLLSAASQENEVDEVVAEDVEGAEVGVQVR